MLRALSKKFPEKYKDLLAEYYGSFVGEQAKGGEKKKEGTEEGGGEEEKKGGGEEKKGGGE
jgi:hypothetical protein